MDHRLPSFPGFFWLLGREPLERIERYGQQLAEIVLPLRPLIVYLDADVATAFDRAIAVRGDLWGTRIIEHLKTWNVPYYPMHSVLAPTCSGSRNG